MICVIKSQHGVLQNIIKWKEWKKKIHFHCSHLHPRPYSHLPYIHICPHVHIFRAGSSKWGEKGHPSTSKLIRCFIVFLLFLFSFLSSQSHLISTLIDRIAAIFFIHSTTTFCRHPFIVTEFLFAYYIVVKDNTPHCCVFICIWIPFRVDSELVSAAAAQRPRDTDNNNISHTSPEKRRQKRWITHNFGKNPLYPLCGCL